MGDALDTVQRALAAFDAGDEDTLRELNHEDVVVEAPGGVTLRGRDAAIAFNASFMRAFADLEVDVHVQVEQGDMVVEEYTMTATHAGTLATPSGDLPATNRRVTLRVAEVYRVESGKIIENRLYYDPTVLASQLGLVP